MTMSHIAGACSEGHTCRLGKSGASITFPPRRKAEVLHPGGQAGEHLVVGSPAHCILLSCHHLHTQQLTQLRMISAQYSCRLVHLCFQARMSDESRMVPHPSL